MPPTSAATIRAALAATLALAAVPARSPAQASPALAVLVVDSASGRPLAGALVALPGTGLQRFTGDDGMARLSAMPGDVSVEVRRVGFRPWRGVVTVPTGVASVRVALSAIPVRLTAVRVVEASRCRRPGLAAVAADTALQEAIGQLRENARQYEALVEAHPFGYLMQRSFLTRRRDRERVESVDTVPVPGRPAWRYRPGAVVSAIDGSAALQLPSPADLASDAFVAAHCWSTGGTAPWTDGATVALVRFRADDRLRAPDVHGVAYLDAGSFALRGYALELSRMPRGTTLRRMVVRACLDEVAPGLPVLAWVRSEQTLQTGIVGRETVIERQARVRLTFSAAAPPGARPVGTAAGCADGAAWPTAPGTGTTP